MVIVTFLSNDAHLWQLSYEILIDLSGLWTYASFKTFRDFFNFIYKHNVRAQLMKKAS